MSNAPSTVARVRPFVGGALALALVAGLFTPALAQVVDTTPPPVPTNISPAHDATVSSAGGIDLEWSSVTDDASNPVTYEFEYSWSASTEADGSFTFPSGTIPGLTTGGLDGAFSGAADGEFYWHVRAVDAAGNESDWSSTSHFTVSGGGSGGGDTTPPPAPTLLTPAMDVTLTSSAYTSVDWSDVSDDSGDPVTYEYEYASSASVEVDGSFSSPAGSATSTSSELTGISGAAEGEYYWHVRAIDASGNEGDWSSTFHFTIDNGSSGDTTAPSVPTLIAPANDASVNSSAGITLDWSDSTDDSGDPVTYEYEYSWSAAVEADGSFSNPSSGSGGLTDSTLSGFMGMSEGEYYWHVRAVDSSGNESAWSTTFHFTVDNDVVAPPPGDDDDGLAWPGNLWPYDGQRLTTAEWTHADWTDVAATATPVTYVYQSSLSSATNADGSFTSPIYTSGTLTASEIPTTGTPEGTYYWHVKAMDAEGNESGWSTMTRVIVENSPEGDVTGPAAPEHLHPADGAVIHPDDHDYVDWTDVTDASEPVRYIYEYSWSTDIEADGGFSHPSFQSAVLDDSRIDITDPEGRAEGTQYWHVRSIDAAGNVGPWSDYWMYTIDEDATSTPGGDDDVATSTQTIVVTPDDLETETNRFLAMTNSSGKWFFYNDETDEIDNTYGSFVTGPGDAPLGDGSVQMTATGTERHNLATYRFADIRLADILGLTFSTYSQSAGNGATTSERAPYLHFNVDFNNSDTWQSRLVYVPGMNGTVELDTWQTWDAISNGDALWRYSGALWPGTGDAGTTAKTWDEILALYPDAETRSTDSWFGFRVGEPYPDGFTGNVDNVSITLSTGTSTASTTTFDFEVDNDNGGSGGGGGDDDENDVNPGRDSSGGGGGSSLIDRNRGGNNDNGDDDGEVLGAATDSCEPLIVTYMREGQANVADQVNTLKRFLNGDLDVNLSLNGMFDTVTTTAVNAFQVKYWEDVLLPWVPFGLPTATTPTGYVYKTTSWKINQLNCAEDNLPAPARPVLP